MARSAQTGKSPRPDPSLSLAAQERVAHADLLVGLSGGRDSVALLHLLSAQRAGPNRRIRAIHVHHGLSPNADAWARFCTELCTRWNIPLVVERVHVEMRPRLSLEAQARAARYAAFHRTCEAGEVLVLAHHADDQIESFFIQLLRGAGPRGLAAMPALSIATATRPPIWRPLLHATRAQIDAYVRHHALAFIEDESNRALRFKRNALRAEVLPALERHFPSYRKALLRAIDHQQTLVQWLDAQTEEVVGHEALPLSRLRECSAAQAAERLRRWLGANGLPLPPAARTQEAVRQLREISTDQRFRLPLGGGWQLYVKRGALCFEHVAP